MSAKLDHIVLATSDLERTKAQFEQLTGVSPAYGGAHVGRGTCNYLVSLGGTQYLEIIGLDPEQDTAALIEDGVHIAFGVHKMPAGAKIVHWACETADLEGISTREAGWTGKPFDMSRKTPHGDVLE